jgi:GTP1/Obg family GTP-binding protein
MQDKTQEIIKEWEKVREVHPSYAEIAKIVGRSKARVYYVVQRHLKRIASPRGKN